MAGRERAWDIELGGIPLVCTRDQTGAPAYRADDVPKIAQETLQIAEEQRDYPSLHLGFGHTRYLQPATFDYADGIDTSMPRRIVMGPLCTTATAAASVSGGFVELGSQFFVAAGRYLQAINTTNDTIATPDNSDYTKGADFGANTTISSVIAWDSLIDVWFSSATDGRTFNGAVAPTTLSGSNVQRVYATKFFSEYSGSMVQAASTTVSSDPAITWIAQGAALDSAIGANWVTQYDIGDDTYAITGVASGNGMVWVAKRDGLYYVDGRSGYARRVFEAYPVSTNNGVGLFTDSAGRVWYPGQAGLLRYNRNNGLVEDATPGRGLSHDAVIYGRPVAVAQYKGWFYCAMYNGTDSYILKGRDRGEGEPGTGPVIWHGAIAKVAGAAISHLYALGQTSPPRLYYAAGTTVGYFRLDAAARYAASGSLYFPADNFGALGSKWSLGGFIVACKGFDTSTYADIYAKLDGGDWQKVNRLQASGRVFVPVPSGDWLCGEMAFRLDFVNASSTVTPEIWGISVLATRRVYTRALIQTTVLCSERVLSKMGMRERRTARGIMSSLEAMTVQGPVELTDWWDGVAYTQNVLVQPVRWRLVRYKDTERGIDEMARVADLTLVALSSETVQVQSSTTRYWGDGTIWGEGARWA